MIICDDADLKKAAQRRRDGPLLQLRPGVPGDQAPVRLRVGRRRDHRGGRGQGQAAARGHRVATPTPSSARCTPRASAASMERQIAESGGEIVAGGGRPEGLDAGWFHEPTVVVEPRQGLADGARGGLRPGAADLARARTSTRRSSWPTTRRSGSARRVWTREPRHAPSAPPPSSTAATRGSTRRPRSTTSCRSAA